MGEESLHPISHSNLSHSAISSLFITSTPDHPQLPIGPRRYSQLGFYQSRSNINTPSRFVIGITVRSSSFTFGYPQLW